MINAISKGKLGLLATVAPIAIALCASPAAAQDTQGASQADPSSNAASASTDATQQQARAQAEANSGSSTNDVVVTGSLVRNPAAATASPVISLSSQDLQNRGVTTVADALQLLTANNAGTAPPSWSSFGFATGASSPSLRGLNNAYTLTLFNGLRTAPYPLGDDGYRNFVDINTIPASIVDRIDTLLDGASATYGSDAIAGVVNVIIKRQVTGLHLNGSAAISQRGDNGERRLSATYGYGDLDTQGFNVYVNGEYQKNSPLFLRDRGYPFNTADQSRICGTADQGCLFNGVRNGIQYDGSFAGFQSTRVPYVRPYSAAGASLGGYQLLNPALGCQGLPSQALTAAQLTSGGLSNGQFITPGTVCQEDLVNEYRAYNSEIERKGGNIRATAKLGEDAEFYAMFNYYNTTTASNNAGPQGFTGATTPPPAGFISTVSNILLPAYVCANGVGTITTIGALTNTATGTGCNALNGTLNPNNPFAAQGQYARLVALPQVSRSTSTNTKTYRFTAGIDGTVNDLFNYSLNGTYSKVTLNTRNNGYIYLRGLLDAIARGTYNFVDQSQNTADQIASVFPENRNRSFSQLWQVQAILDKDLFALPGGDLNVAVTGQYRDERISNPSANDFNADPTQRFFGINAVGVIGSRHVWSAGYEVTAPILDILKLKASGSYDSYSTGPERFSPKFEAEFRPIEQIKLRGTFSKGFRIPSFQESFAFPTTGYVSATINCASPTYATFCAQHANNPSYYQGSYSYGLTSQGNRDLSPEKSTGYTFGAVITPVRNVTITVDYFRTKLSNVIIPAQVTPDIINQYYTNNGQVNAPGITVTPGTADPLNPGALPLLGFAAGSYQNADSYLVRGIDASISAKFPLTEGIQYQTIGNVSRLLRLQQTLANGDVQRYDGTLGPCNITSCSGAPRWRATWQNTLDFNGRGNISLTAYYTSGFSSVAADSGGVYGDCAQSALNGQLVTYDNGDPVQCRAKSVFYMDGHAEVRVQDNFTFYFDVKNLLDKKPKYDPNAAYGLYQFNPAWSDALFIGRYFRFGAKVDF